MVFYQQKKIKVEGRGITISCLHFVQEFKLNDLEGGKSLLFLNCLKDWGALRSWPGYSPLYLSLCRSIEAHVLQISYFPSKLLSQAGHSWSKTASGPEKQQRTHTLFKTSLSQGPAQGLWRTRACHTATRQWPTTGCWEKLPGPQDPAPCSTSPDTWCYPSPQAWGTGSCWQNSEETIFNRPLKDLLLIYGFFLFRNSCISFLCRLFWMSHFWFFLQNKTR